MKTLSILRPFLITCACLALLAVGLHAADASAAEAKTTLPRLVDLGADKCIPCKMMAPLLAELAKEYAGQLDVVFIDVWKNREEGPRYGIRVIPTQILYDAKGKELFRHEGFYAKKDILAKWKELGVELREPTTTKAN
jgi:thioredoxin 1